MCGLAEVIAGKSLILQVEHSKIWKTNVLGVLPMLSRKPNLAGLGEGSAVDAGACFSSVNRITNWS